ncbi:MAG: peptide/nickel transport system permease protein [Clostridia bacterium]|jgi:peptide/nickel transport system permease protein|nr:peptide/nickel transport system permease protein [Clostridia bacterium]
MSVPKETAAQTINTNQSQYFLKLFSRNKTAVFGAVIFILLILIALFAPVITPCEPDEMNPAQRLQAPDTDHLFGTDRFGRDLYTRVVYGSRISLGVGVSVVFLTTFFGTIIGLLAGYFRSIDEVLMRFLDGLMAFPSIILMIAIMAVLGGNLINVIIALAIVYTPRTARVVRSAVLVQKEHQYIEAARAIGCSNLRITVLHILPNCVAPIIIQATMIFAYSVLSESSLSFLGVGVPPEIPTWGNILSDGKVFLRKAPWITIFPGVTIALCVLALNTMGDGLRDILDPKIRKK